jgi:hypothetical protein
MRGIMHRGQVQRRISAEQLDVLAGMYHLVHNTDEVPWKRVVQDYQNEAGDPVLIRTVCMTPSGAEYRMNHFQLSNNIHEQLIERSGHYLFVAYRLNSHGAPTIVHHGMQPASKFPISVGMNTKVHPRDIFTGVVG